MTTFFQPKFETGVKGRTIVGCVDVAMCDGDRWPGLMLDDGSYILIQSDGEGNSGGFMELSDKTGKRIGCGGMK
jgi:hypothetical protein